MDTFFICSLPRSRTAWTANFLTIGDSFCFHEPFAEFSPKDLPKLFTGVDKKAVGVADSLCTVFIEELLTLFPQSKVVVVRRPVADVITSVARLGLYAADFMFRLDQQLSVIEKTYDPLVIDFNHFDAPKIWFYLFPDVPLDVNRLRLLEDLRIVLPVETSFRKGRKLLEQVVR